MQCTQVLSIAEQVGNFTALARQWASGNNGSADLLSKSLFFISAGSNDLLEHAAGIGPQINDTELLQRLVASYTSLLRVSPKYLVILSFTIPTCQVL